MKRNYELIQDDDEEDDRNVHLHSNPSQIDWESVLTPPINLHNNNNNNNKNIHPPNSPALSSTNSLYSGSSQQTVFTQNNIQSQGSNNNNNNTNRSVRNQSQSSSIDENITIETLLTNRCNACPMQWSVTIEELDELCTCATHDVKKLQSYKRIREEYILFLVSWCRENMSYPQGKITFSQVEACVDYYFNRWCIPEPGEKADPSFTTVKNFDLWGKKKGYSKEQRGPLLGYFPVSVSPQDIFDHFNKEVEIFSDILSVAYICGYYSRDKKCTLDQTRLMQKCITIFIRLLDHRNSAIYAIRLSRQAPLADLSVLSDPASAYKDIFVNTTDIFVNGKRIPQRGIIIPLPPMDQWYPSLPLFPACQQVKQEGPATTAKAKTKANNNNTNNEDVIGGGTGVMDMETSMINDDQIGGTTIIGNNEKLGVIGKSVGLTRSDSAYMEFMQCCYDMCRRHDLVIYKNKFFKHKFITDPKGCSRYTRSITPFENECEGDIYKTLAQMGGFYDERFTYGIKIGLLSKSLPHLLTLENPYLPIISKKNRHCFSYQDGVVDIERLDFTLYDDPTINIHTISIKYIDKPFEPVIMEFLNTCRQFKELNPSYAPNPPPNYSKVRWGKKEKAECKGYIKYIIDPQNYHIAIKVLGKIRCEIFDDSIQCQVGKPFPIPPEMLEDDEDSMGMVEDLNGLEEEEEGTANLVNVEQPTTTYEVVFTQNSGTDEGGGEFNGEFRGENDDPNQSVIEDVTNEYLKERKRKRLLQQQQQSSSSSPNVEIDEILTNVDHSIIRKRAERKSRQLARASYEKTRRIEEEASRNEEIRTKLSAAKEEWEEVLYTMYALCGQRFFKRNKLDKAGIALFLYGVAGTGKTGIIDAILQFFDSADVKSLSDAAQKDFGLAGAGDKMFVYFGEYTPDCQVPTAVLQEWITDTCVSLNKKFDDSFTIDPESVLTFVGNFPFRAREAGNAMGRRMVYFWFKRPWPDYAKKSGAEYRKCMENDHVRWWWRSILSYRLFANRLAGGKDVWHYLPQYFRTVSEHIKVGANPLRRFLNANIVFVDPIPKEEDNEDFYISEERFKELYSKYCTENHIAQREWKDELYQDVFILKGINRRSDCREWPIGSGLFLSTMFLFNIYEMGTIYASKNDLETFFQFEAKKYFEITGVTTDVVKSMVIFSKFVNYCRGQGKTVPTWDSTFYTKVANKFGMNVVDKVCLNSPGSRVCEWNGIKLIKKKF
jgi:hypothetical protein